MATYLTTKSPRASSPAATPALRHLAVAQKNAQRFKHPGSCLHVAHMPSQTTALQTLNPHITLRAMESDCLSKRTDDGAAHVFNTGGDGSNQDGALCTRFSLWGIVPLHNNLLAAADNLRLLWDLFPLTLTFCSFSFALVVCVFHFVLFYFFSFIALPFFVLSHTPPPPTPPEVHRAASLRTRSCTHARKIADGNGCGSS
jgi:hypothetical protein